MEIIPIQTVGNSLQTVSDAALGQVFPSQGSIAA